MLGSASPSASIRPPFVAMGQVWGGQDKTNVPHGKKNLCVVLRLFLVKPRADLHPKSKRRPAPCLSSRVQCIWQSCLNHSCIVLE